MRAEILMIGTELLLGDVVDTNAAFMGRVLAENGIHLFQKTTVGDNPGRIMQALEAALVRADVVLTSGGLGPTEDDITRECVAELMERELVFQQALYDELINRFSRFRFQFTENNRKQAMIPEGGRPIENPNGTAPGIIVEDPRGTVICMPGVPGELKAMLTERVIPYLRDRFAIEGILHSRVLKVCGLGESRVDAAMGDLILSQKNPTVGVLASPEAVRIRITAHAATQAEADVLIEPVDAAVRERLPGAVMGTDDTSLEQVVDALFQERGWTLAVAEVQTGGAIAQRLVAAGARSFAGGRVFPDPVTEPQVSVDMAAEIMLNCSALCGLAVTFSKDRTSTRVALVTPETTVEWTLGYARFDTRSQVRACVAVLERIRRFLLNCPALDV